MAHDGTATDARRLGRGARRGASPHSAPATDWHSDPRTGRKRPASGLRAQHVAIRHSGSPAHNGGRGMSAAPVIRTRLLSVQEAALYLGRTKRAVEGLVAKGTVPVVRLDGRVQFDVRDLDR